MPAGPDAVKLLSEALVAAKEADFERAGRKINEAFTREPRLKRVNAPPQTIEELMPLLRRKAEAGQVMRQMRRSFGLTQFAMAEVCGVPGNYISRVEAGRQSMSEAAITNFVLWIADKGAREIKEGPPPAALLKLRRLLGFTAAALAYKLNCKESAIVRWETGNGPIPMATADAYRRLAKERGYNLDELAA